MTKTLRTEAEEKKYMAIKKKEHKDYCFLCAKDMLREEFKLWFICGNRYPYTQVAEKHDLLAPIRHVKDFSELTEPEIFELIGIMSRVHGRELGYDQVLFNIPHRQSNPFHFHLHLIRLK